MKKKSFSNIKKIKNTHKKRKIFGAMALGMLLFSGGAFAVPHSNNPITLQSNNFKQIRDNPTDFLKMNRLEFRKNFDYFEELNNEFSENPSTKITNEKAERALLEAIENENYPAWKSALKNLEGYPKNVGVISEEDFKILVKVHKARKDL